ncbi:hypothetical protein RB195_000376 [Necator americanus]|uniref:MADF domain-containing protein n=1 Tax=Necator americanus TaxID=51031 RepID=A0ABR1D9D9_NECAM
MSRRKSEATKALSVEEASLRERPVWNDTLRGILVALVKDRRALWDARFRTSKERTMYYFREIADILSNQDIRMNEWSVLEKWCWMVEMYMRAVERPSFEWRFKGVMGFHNEFGANGVQYLGSLTPEVLIELTTLYAETEAELQEIKTELNKNSRKGCGTYRADMMIYHKSKTSSVDSEAVRPKATAKRGRPRRVPTVVPERALSDIVNAKNSKGLEEEQVVRPKLTNGKSVTIKQENPDRQSLPDKSQSGVSGDPDVASVVEKNMKTTMDENADVPRSATSALIWSTDMVDQLIRCVKEIPALWHYGHPHYLNSSLRKIYFSKIAERMHSLPGAAAINEDHVSEKWKQLCDSFNQELKKMKQEGNNSAEHHHRLHFLTPEVMSTSKFEDLANGHEALATSSADLSIDVQSQINKILGCIPELAKRKEIGGVANKKPKLDCNSQNSVKTHIELDTIPHVQQVVSTWVPPREDSLDTVLQSFSSTPPTATAQVTVKNDIAHILQNPSPRISMNGSKIGYGEFVEEHSVRPYEDKWTLMGRMIEETARELEAKHSELAYRLQKDINDVIFKYQLESLRHK